jgi:methylated-DNA-[protein]-cysteine S-methyltransferase
MRFHRDLQARIVVQNKVLDLNLQFQIFNNPNMHSETSNLDSLAFDIHKLSIQQIHLTDFQRTVYAYTKMIPKGRVSTYKNIAIAIGRPGSSRAVGTALSKNPFASVPCHRVIASNGSIGGFMGKTGKCVEVEAKIRLLQAEGLIIENGRLSKMSTYWSKVVIVPTGMITPNDLTDSSLTRVI